MCCRYSWYSTDQCHLSLCGKKKKSAAAVAQLLWKPVGTHPGLYGNFMLAPTEIERKKDEKKKDSR